MKTFELNKKTAKAEFDLLYEIWKEYRKDPWAVIGIEIKTPEGIFVNKGGTNNHPFDFWLVKKGTKGTQSRTFWRTGIGNKHHFKVFIYDLRYTNVTKDNYNDVAKQIGAKTLSINDLKFFTKQ